MKFSRQRLLSWSVLLVLFVALVVAVVFVHLIGSRPEPSYQEKSLSEWLDDLDNSPTSVAYSNAVLAIRHLGTNAVPFLVDDLNASDSGLRVDVQMFMARHGLGPPVGGADGRKGDALLGIKVLGPVARSAIPALAWQLTHQPASSSDGTYIFAEALSDIGPAAISVLEAASTNGNRLAREDAVQVLMDMGDTNVISALLAMRKSADPGERMTAVSGLPKFPLHAAVIVPALMDSLDDPDSLVSRTAAKSLAKMGAAARPALPKLKKLLFSGDDKIFSAAVRAMAELDGAGTFVDLTNALASADTNKCRRAVFALGELGADGEGAVPALIKYLHDSDASIRYTAAVALGGIRKDPDVVVPALAAGLSDPELNVSMANATALAEFGKRAAVAGPEIIGLLGKYKSDEEVRGQLYYVLDKMDPAAAAEWDKTNGVAGK